MTDFLDVKRQEITDRLKELAPLVDEYRRLEAAASALAGVGASSTSTTTAAPAAAPRRRRGPGRPRGSSGKRTATTAATAAAAGAAETPPSERKKVGRPPGSGKKVGRPPGSGKKVGRPAGGKVGRPTRQSGTSQRQWHACRSGAVVRARPARYHDSRARREDGDQAELPLPRASRTRAGREAGEERPRLALEGLVSSSLALSSVARVPSTLRSLRPSQERRSVGLSFRRTYGTLILKGRGRDAAPFFFARLPTTTSSCLCASPSSRLR